MADDTTQRGAQDRSRISLSERYEVEYWTRTMNVSEARLREAVAAVGSSASAVREYLQ